jgi:hypothetical protein
MSAGEGREQEGEGLSLRSQPFDRVRHRMGEIGAEPAREGEDVLRGERGRNERNLADDLRLLASRGPYDENLRLRHHQRGEPINVRLQRCNLRTRPAVAHGRAIVGAHQHDRGQDRKDKHAEKKRERGELMRTEAREELHIGAAELEIDRGLGGGGACRERGCARSPAH